MRVPDTAKPLRSPCQRALIPLYRRREKQIKNHTTITAPLTIPPEFTFERGACTGNWEASTHKPVLGSKEYQLAVRPRLGVL